jgi:hypothetical protein
LPPSPPRYFERKEEGFVVLFTQIFKKEGHVMKNRLINRAAVLLAMVPDFFRVPQTFKTGFAGRWPQ